MRVSNKAEGVIFYSLCQNLYEIDREVFPVRELS